jgi:hypothetical protein
MVHAMNKKPAYSPNTAPKQSNKRDAPTYTGELARPIRIPWPSDDGERLFICLSEHLKKLDLLAAHYEVDLKEPEAMLTLVMKLAEQHVPGFRIELPDLPAAPRGRPKTKTSQYDLGLLICRELNSRECGEPGSATRLAKELAKIEIETAAKREGRNLSSYSKKGSCPSKETN